MTGKQKFVGGVVGVAVLGGLIVAGVHWLKKAPQPPLKIRGGAMTLRYPLVDGKDPWFPYQSGSLSGYCTTLDTSSGKAKLKIFQHPDPDTDDPTEKATTPTIIELKGAWFIDLYGRNPDFTPDPHEGIELRAVADCNGSKNGISVLPLRGSANSTFYSLDLPSHDGSTFGKRYKKNACPDEDACEHLSTIYVSSSSLSSPTSPDCENGECLVKIVAP